MAVTVTVQCVGCKARKEVGPGTDIPMCDECFNPMVAVKASVRPRTVSEAWATNKRNVRAALAADGPEATP